MAGTWREEEERAPEERAAGEKGQRAPEEEDKKQGEERERERGERGRRQRRSVGLVAAAIEFKKHQKSLQSGNRLFFRFLPLSSQIAHLADEVLEQRRRRDRALGHDVHQSLLQEDDDVHLFVSNLNWSWRRERSAAK